MPGTRMNGEAWRLAWLSRNERQAPRMPVDDAVLRHVLTKKADIDKPRVAQILNQALLREKPHFKRGARAAMKYEIAVSLGRAIGQAIDKDRFAFIEDLILMKVWKMFFRLSV